MQPPFNLAIVQGYVVGYILSILSDLNLYELGVLKAFHHIQCHNSLGQTLTVKVSKRVILEIVPTHFRFAWPR